MKRNLFWCIGLVLFLAMSGVVQAELLTNPSFEIDDNEDDWPDDWSAWWQGYGGGSYGIGEDHTDEPNNAHDGNDYIVAGGASGYSAWWPTENAPVEWGVSYVVSAWFYDETNSPGDSGELKLEWYDENGARMSWDDDGNPETPEVDHYQIMLDIPDDNRWHYYQIATTPIEGAVSVRPVFVGSYWEGRPNNWIEGRVRIDSASVRTAIEPNNPPAVKVLEWKLDDGAGMVATDSSGNGNDGDLLGDPQWVDGALDGGLEFDGDGDMVQDLNVVNLPTDANDSWSMNVYVYIEESIHDDANYDGMRICGFGTDSWGSDSNYLDGSMVGHGRSIGNDGGIAFLSDGMRPIKTGLLYVPGQWQMITVTYDYDTLGMPLKIYKNGKLLKAARPEGMYYTGQFNDTEAIAHLAHLHNEPDPNQEHIRFTGKLDEFTIWESVLTEEQIQEMAEKLPYMPAVKVLEWKLDDGTGVVADDSTANNNDGQVLGGATWDSGIIGGALVFDGNDDEVNSPELVNLPTDPYDSWSMNVYVYIDEPIYDANRDEMRICGFGTDAWGSDANYLDGFYMGNGRSLGNYYGISFFSDGMWSVNTNVPYSLGRWQMVTAVYNSGNIGLGNPLTLYKNGHKIGQGDPQGIYYTGRFAEADPVAHLAHLHNIHDPNQRQARFAGKLDEFSIWKGALTEDQIQDLLVYIPKDDTVELVLEWKLDENSGETAYDTSGYGNDGVFFDEPGDYSSPEWEPGVSGSSIFFDIYNSDYIETPDMNTTVNLPVNPEESWSMNVYVYMDFDINDWAEFEGTRMCGFGTDSWNAQGADDTDPNDPGKGAKMGRGRSILNVWGNKIGFGTEGMWYVGSDEPWDIELWQMVTAIYDAELVGFGDPLRLYKNGKLIGTADPRGYYYTGTLRTADALANIGKRPNYGGEVVTTTQFDFEGWIDEFTVWRGALSQKQISELLYSSVDTILLGDLDYDDDVDGLDLKILADVWLSTEGIADIHGVGIVNSIDFAIQADNWLVGTP